MTQADFTLGPWGVDEQGDVRGYGQGSPCGEDLIATVLGSSSTQAEANSNLIAAAPDLYEALRQICTYVREAIDDGALDAIVALDAIDAVACAVLAKARGGQVTA